jgi:hypothetical protein
MNRMSEIKQAKTPVKVISFARFLFIKQSRIKNKAPELLPERLM